ncbi:hypothetical protein HAX54_007984 [Datura stramonium]|uniref:Ubiquitin-like domain-containing protein n=1 Tax=Datura stramonium TaxID=4076 RepID=A0ABS8TCG6_DATST|nr:hypothetical protein [Datura stramonium]
MAHVSNTIDITVRFVDHQAHRLYINQVSVQNLKEQIAFMNGIPIEQQRLFYNGQVLQNDQLLSSYRSIHSLGASSRPNSLQILPPYLDRMRREYSTNETGNDMHEVLPSAINSITPSAEEIPRAEQLARLLSSTRDMLINQTSQCLLELEGDLRHNQNVVDLRVGYRTHSNAQRSERIFNNLGAYLLELARTMMQVEMGDNKRTATINVGPSLYITDDLHPNPLSIQKEGSTIVSMRRINNQYELYPNGLCQRQHSAESSFSVEDTSESFQNMPSQYQHEQDSANIRQHSNTELTDIHEKDVKPGTTIDSIDDNIGIGESSEPKSVHKLADELANEDIGNSD